MQHRRGTFASARDDLLWRIDRLGHCQLDSPHRLAVFDDVVAAFCPSGFEFRPDYSACEVVMDNGGAIRLSGELWVAAGKAASIERILHVRARVANHEFLRVHGDYQGTALAPLIIRQSFLFFDRIGIETAIVHAGLETGVYYWARCGFDFLKEEERQHVRAWFNLMLNALGRDFDDNLQTAYQLVNVGKDTDQRVSMEMLANVFPGGGENTEVRDHFASAAVGNGMTYDQEMDLGKALFLSYPRTWWGYMDLNLKAGQRVLFEVYAQSRLQLAAC